MKIRKLNAKKVLNSRGESTIEVSVNGFSAAAPSGASVGSHEVQAFPKQGIGFCIDFINNFKEIEKLNFREFEDLEKVEHILPVVGANTVIALEYALLKALSKGKVWKFLNPSAKSLPTPLGNCVGGGAHVKRGIDIQEILLIPEGRNFYERSFVNKYVYNKIGKVIGTKNKTDEGAWAPIMSDFDALSSVFDVVQDVSKTLNTKVKIGIDHAASELWKNNAYRYKNLKGSSQNLTKTQQVNLVKEMVLKFKLKYVEDPMQQEDFVGFSKVRSSGTLICGDDLICTSLERLKEALKRNAVNCIIVKPNQVGSLIRTKEIVDFAAKNRIATVISHRSGETLDATISHLAVAWNIPYIKAGIYGPERQAKLKELIQIEKEI
ncbi:MAG: enolase C-terminal domain-like protein [archaeon]